MKHWSYENHRKNHREVDSAVRFYRLVEMDSVTMHGILLKQLRRRCLWVALARAWAAAYGCLAQGTIVRVTAPDDFGTFQGGVLPVDVDSNGSDDFMFVSTRGDFTVNTPSLNAVVGIPAGGLDLGVWARPLDVGALIGDQLDNGLVWGETLHTPYGDVRPLLTSCMDVGCIGLFTGQNAYLGIRFQAIDGTHYGWMRLDLPFIGINGGYIREWAYETRADVPILIPEPTTCALFVMGAIVLLRFKHR